MDTQELIISHLQPSVYIPTPLWYVYDHADREDWKPIVCEVAAGEDLCELIAAQICGDLGDLVADGDTDADDGFLALFDGLKKRIEWPDHFALSSQITMEDAGKIDGEPIMRVKFWIASVDEPHVAPTT
jgi:hypothetical protein